ncbi:MAG: preprotein translocase subunit SecE [Alphaproteobacteria bacterium]|nr:preprotein translocase subunit SecE [Alphaproteobacteria bacterium]
MKTSPAQFVRQVKQEVSKITWPTKAETMQGSIVVIVMSVLIALFLFVIDMIFAKLIQVVLGG